MFKADIWVYTNAKSVFSEVYSRHCWFVTRSHVIQLDPFQNFSFLLGAAHRIAEEWFLYFVLGVHHTTQLFHTWEIVLRFVSEVMGVENNAGKPSFTITRVL